MFVFSCWSFAVGLQQDFANIVVCLSYIFLLRLLSTLSFPAYFTIMVACMAASFAARALESKPVDTTKHVQQVQELSDEAIKALLR